MLYVFVFNFNTIVYSQIIQSDIQVCCSIKSINTEYIIFLPDLIIFASRAVDILTRYTHIPSDMSMGIHKPQGHPYHCDTGHRDYKRIEAASGDESRNKLNKSNGGKFKSRMYANENEYF